MERYKWRFQLLMAVLVFLASTALTGFYIYESQKHAQQRAEASAKYISTVYTSIIDAQEHTYKYRAYGNLLIQDFEHALIERDREKLYSLIINRFHTMQDENPDLIIMQFHAPDGTSILRVHEKEKYGDYIAHKRPLVQRLHDEKTIQSGFEGGIAGVAYRVLVPYFHDKQYIGGVEFGIDVKHISKELYKTTGLKSTFFLHKSRIAAASVKDRYENYFGQYTPIEMDADQYAILKRYAENNPRYEKKIISYEGHHYEVVPIKLNGDDGKAMGIFLCINDVSDGYHDIRRTILGSLVITIVLILMFLAINESVARKIMKQVRFQEQYIETILNSQYNIIVVTNGRNIVYVNHAFLEYLHYPTLEDFIKVYPCICYKFEESETERLLQPEMDGMTWTEYILAHQETEHKAKISVDGKTSIFSVHARKLDYEDELRYVVVFTDVTELNRLATLDQLTQIPNRFEFDKVLAHAISVAERYQKTFSLLLIDIDFFKQINDQYGHLTGDKVLKTFSMLLKQQIRNSDIVARWGGEEFMILLPNTPLESATKMGESLRQRIEIEPFEEVSHVTCSIGIAEYIHGEEADALLKRVDDKLYIAKNNGRNQVVC